MLAALKSYIKLALVPLLFIGGIVIMLLTVFKEAMIGLAFMVSLIPQPNVWHKFYEYPMGKDFLDFLFLAVLLGMFLQKKGFAKTDNSWLIIMFIIVSYLSLWNSSMRFSLTLPISHNSFLLYDWKNYAEMIFMYFLVVNIVKNEDQQKMLIVIMSLVILLIAIRSYRGFSGGASFHWDKRFEGPFWATGLGPNEFAAFISYCFAIFLGLFLLDKDKKRKLLFLATVLFCLHPILFSYSRGAYLATLSAIAFLGLIKKRSLLIAIIVILLAWKSILPQSVVDRIEMTRTEEGQIEHSAGGRPELWRLAIDLFKENPVFGVGFHGYSLTVGGTTLDTGEVLKKRQDPHSLYLKILSEQGLVGFTIFLYLIYKSFRSGWRLFRIGITPFQQGLGLGFMGCIASLAISNIFSDGWSYFVLGSYFWIFWGLVDRSILNIQNTYTQKIV